VEDTFDGAFETVRRSTPHPSYISIIAKSKDEQPLQPRLDLGTESSARSSTNGSQRQMDRKSPFDPFLAMALAKKPTKSLTRRSAPLHTVLLVRQPSA
jgi:hypothetical protein